MRVLGIDPGSRLFGWGVVETTFGSKLRWVGHGVISPPPRASLEVRLSHIHEELCKVIGDTSPDVCSVEEIFFAASVKSALVLGHARGVALLAAAQAGLEVHSYAPALIKQAVVGTGRAEKEQVARMVSVILGVPTPGQSDATDALAIAITHATRGGSAAGRAGAFR